MLTREERENLKVDSIIYLCYDYILAISEDRILATHGQEISLISIDGDIICTFDSIYVPEYPKGVTTGLEGEPIAIMEYVDDILVYVDNGYMGILDYNGMPITGAIYRDITFKSNDEIELLP